jgi:hypothetical protein
MEYQFFVQKVIKYSNEIFDVTLNYSNNLVIKMTL